MERIYNRIVILTIFVFSIFCSIAYSDEQLKTKMVTYDFSLGLGATAGTTKEYVYYSDGDVMSRLDWQEYCTPSVNLSANVDIFHAIITGEYSSIIPLKLGIMEDWDFLKADRSKATNYSKSPLIINKNFKAKILAGYEFSVYKFKILPQLGFCYQNKKYEAYGGYYQYADTNNNEYWSPDLQKYPLYGNCITYEQQYFIPSINLKTTYVLNENWSFCLYGFYSPYIKGDGSDFHCATSEKLYQYNDYMKGGYGFSIGIGAKYKKFGVYFEYEYLQIKEGHTTYRKIATNSSFLDRTDTKPGTESSLFTLKLVYNFK